MVSFDGVEVGRTSGAALDTEDRKLVIDRPPDG